ncbi:hypothetical protein CASFOL_017016 [Castilleja foliolosa]|uniref:F-box domain-containing protein n=1 Tax=Castilleja foliolosa TaxID=1961234 RepID=A0ABD3DD42_9LAMI
MKSAKYTEQPRFIHNIPDPVLDEILVRVPVNDLCSCKCVCTRWLSTISSAEFTSLHLNRTNSDPSKLRLIVQYIRLEDDEVEPPNPPVPVEYYDKMGCLNILGSVNGLTLLVDEIEGRGSKWYQVLIWNIATTKMKTVDLCEYENAAKVTFGFGWAANVYKVVKFVYYRGKTTCEVWRSDTDTWRDIEVNTVFVHPGMESFADVTVKGGSAAYWLFSNFDEGETDESSDSDDDTVFMFEVVVVAFDFETELLHTIPLPMELKALKARIAADFRSHKGVFCMNLRDEFALVERLSSKDQYKGWTYDFAEARWKSENVDFPIDVSNMTCLDTYKEKIILCNTEGRRLVVLNMEDGEATDIGIGQKCWYRACYVIESLVSIE